jgi:Rha family phage regulatory protein
VINLNQLVFIDKKKRLVTDSLMVAQKFDKEHRNVLRDIRNLECSEEFSLLNFEHTFYKAQNGQDYEKYHLTRDGFVFLVMGYTGKQAARFKEDYIKAFNQMEVNLKALEQPSYMIDDPVKRAEKWIEEAKEKQLLLVSNDKKDQIIGELKPKADYTDSILKNKGLVNIGQIAKDYGMSANTMNKKLHDLKVQYKQAEQWLLYRNYQDKGYTHSNTIDIVRSDGRPDIKMNTKWTQKGRLFIYNLLKTQGIIPVIERKENPTG